MITDLRRVQSADLRIGIQIRGEIKYERNKNKE
jgi:hypothetical protein